MKKPILFFVALCILFVSINFAARAVSFEGDASYLLSAGGSKQRGFAAHAMIELIDHFFVDGSFLTTNSKTDSDGDNGGSAGESRSLLSVGGLYRPVNDGDLKVFVGGGFLRLTAKTGDADPLAGQGIYGKFGFKFLPMPKLSLTADVSFAPKYQGAAANTSGSLISARATATYEIIAGLGLQGTIKHYRTSAASSINDTLVGGGVTFSF